MREPGTDPVRPDDAGASPVAPAPKQLCIISGDPLRPRAFMAALDPALRANEELTIIVDRRRAGSANAANRPLVERRRHPSVDAKVKADGFAIVPLSTDDPPWVEQFSDRQSPDDEADAGERAIQRILEFRRRRQLRVGPLLGVSAVVGALIVLVVVFVQMPGRTASVDRSPPAAIGNAEQPAAAPTPSTVETAPPRRITPSASRPDQVSRPRSTPRAPAEGVSTPPRPRPSASPQPEGRPSSTEPASRSRTESIGEPRDTQPVVDVTPPARPRTAGSPPQTAGSPASAPEPSRSPENASTPKSQTAAPPGEPPARPGGAPSQPTAASTLRDLESLVSRDVSAAGVEAERQFGEMKSKMEQTLDELRRVWTSTKRAFTDPSKDRNSTSGEAAAQPRR